MITELIVLGSMALGLAFTVVWWLRPELRARIEQPKHPFLTRARRYDRTLHD